ncbi:MAG: glycoside hydrolase family 2 [Bacteroidales bacterium]|nr:glycoside hydrolase family 2 [Bacteroidales bacterium]
MNKVSVVFCAFCLLLLGACAGEKASESIPLSEHPRPDFERAEWINLNGHWAFTFDSAAAEKTLSEGDLTAMTERILVPFPWGSKLSEVESKGDIGWYARDIKVPSSWKGKRVFLVVGASDWDTQVWLDGKEVGSHQGGYTPFECELKDVTFGKSQTLVIKADDTASDAHLYGKQGYGNARGIWQTVYLEARGENFISSLHFSPDVDNSSVKVDVALAAPASQGESFKLAFKTGDQETFTGDMQGKDKASFVIPIKDQHLWDLDDPFLYEVTASLGGQDKVESYFGQRKISTVFYPGADYKYVALNDKPIYLQLCLDQSYHPEGFYTFPSDEFMKNEILISKKLGLNGNRIHIKVEVPRKLYWADKLGLLIMADTPNFWGEPIPEARADWENCLRGQVERDYNHPSIFAWVNFNETWGLRFDEEGYTPETQEWVRSMYKLTKSLDPTRLVEDQSACNRDHVESDINSWHSYRPGWDWNREIKYYVDNTYPGSHFNYIGDNVQTDVPMINSECGDVWGYHGSAGDCDFTWDYHIMIDAFRRYPKCAGWLYTEHHDVINEWNGYVQYDRSPKIDGLDEIVPGMTIADFQSPYYIQPLKYLYTVNKPGEWVNLDFHASFMTDKDPGKMSLETELVGYDAVGEFKKFEKLEIPVEFKPWLNEKVASQRIHIPEENGLYWLKMTLKNGQGEAIHHNFTTFRVKDGKNPVPDNTRILSFAPSSYTASEWSNGQTSIYNGLKENGFGHGYFEYTIDLPKDLDLEGIRGAELLFEASAKEMFGKDKDGEEDKGDRMLGGGSYDHCKSPNSYAMTDTTFWPSKLTVSVNGKVIGKVDLKDDPADHRGILSWGAQPFVPEMREAGSYGELVRMDVPLNDLPYQEILRTKKVTLRFTVPAEDLDGGLAIYGKDFGRYPLDPTIIIRTN